MQVVINKKPFLAELTQVEAVTEKKNTIPVLANVLLEASGGVLSLFGTDLDTALQTSVEANIIREGSICVNAKKIFEFVKTLSDGEIELRVVDDKLMVSQGKSTKMKMAALGRENFPELPANKDQWIALPASTLDYAFGHTSYAITNEESRYALHGAKFQIQKQKLYVVATDGHRLALVKSKDGLLPEDLSIDVLIPRKTITAVSKLIAGVDSVEFGKDENHAYFRAGKRVLSTRLLTGQFPQWELVIPKPESIKHRARVDSKALQNGGRRVLLTSDEKSHSLKMTLNQDSLKLEAQSADVGESEDTLAISYEGSAPSEPLVIGLNGTYLLDVCGLIEGEMEIQIKDGASQLSIVPVKESDGLSFQSVLMPMRI